MHKKQKQNNPLFNTQFPIFLPDATRGVAKGLDSLDLKQAGVRGVVVNTFHLMETPGIEVLEQFGGVKGFMKYPGIVVSDSGGWQVYSLIHRGNFRGKITDEGVIFGIGTKKKEVFTPQKSIQVQFSIGSDVIICLDDFVPPNASFETAKDIVNRTVKWAKVCKDEYENQLSKKNSETHPLLFAVIQGGYFKELRKECAERLVEIGFDGLGYGGYMIDENGNLDLETSEYIVSLIPDSYFKFALGFGRPTDIVQLYKQGWQIFDCTLPTRDARHQRLYTGTENKYIYINKKMFSQDLGPIEEGCDCHTCQNFSRAYLHHLFKIKDTAAYRLAAIHNIRNYTRLTEGLM